MSQSTEQQILIQAINIYKELLNGSGVDLSNVEASLTSIDTTLLRSNWTKKAGNSIENTYYVAPDVVNNPSGNVNLKEVIYKTGGVQVFKEVITYNGNDDIVTITYV